MIRVQLSPPHQIPSQTWQNMPSFGTERLNPKGVKPFFMPEHNQT